MIAISLPWPDARLSPNGRGHWRVSHEAKQTAKANAFWIAKEAIGQAIARRPVHVAITFHPKSKRRQDDDNMLASNKAALDGVAQALGVDDSEWSISIKRGEPVKGGRVDLWISGASLQRVCSEGESRSDKNNKGD
jgi:crossover junction endodeoxyribonuclease RusA